MAAKVLPVEIPPPARDNLPNRCDSSSRTQYSAGCQCPTRPESPADRCPGQPSSQDLFRFKSSVLNSHFVDCSSWLCSSPTVTCSSDLEKSQDVDRNLKTSSAAPVVCVRSSPGQQDCKRPSSGENLLTLSEFATPTRIGFQKLADRTLSVGTSIEDFSEGYASRSDESSSILADQSRRVSQQLDVDPTGSSVQPSRWSPFSLSVGKSTWSESPRRIMGHFGPFQKSNSVGVTIAGYSTGKSSGCKRTPATAPRLAPPFESSVRKDATNSRNYTQRRDLPNVEDGRKTHGTAGESQLLSMIIRRVPRIR